MAKKGGAPENLDPVRTKEEAKKRGANGGRKSGEARRRKRDAQSAAKLILDLPCTDSIADNLGKMLVDEKDFTNRVAIFARAYVSAQAGDIRAMDFIIKAAGEYPEQKINKKRFDNEIGKQTGSNNAIDDWVNSIPETIDNEDDSNGNDSSGKTP